LAEGGIIWLVFRSEGGFFFYWRPFHGLMTLLAAMLPCLIVISSMVAFFASAKSRSQRLIWTATGIAFLVFPLCLASWVAWYMLDKP
jgi:hypothetical protein